METEKWNTKEKYMTAFWLLSATALALMIFLNLHESSTSASIKNLGLLALLFGFFMSPQFFPTIKRNYTSPNAKTMDSWSANFLYAPNIFINCRTDDITTP